MNCLVTGCAGFIGWKTAEKLLEQGHQVIGIDNMNNYYDPALKEWRLNTLRSFEKFTFYKQDISKFESLREIFQQHSIDVIFNLAARAGVRASVEDPWVYYETNLKGSLNLLECCKEFGVKKYVMASTSSVYGLNEIPFRESDFTDKVLSPYAATKKGAEVLCHTYHYLFGIDTIIPRYFTVYGPAGRPDMAIFKFIRWIDTGEPIEIYGDGTQSRDFTYVDDVAEATLKCATLSGYHILNVGNNNPVGLMTLVELIETTLGKKAQLTYKERNPADAVATWADISQSKALLNWQPKIDLKTGVQRVVDWYIQNREWVLSLKPFQ